MAQLIITSDPAKEAGEHISNTIQEHVGDIVCLLSGGSAMDIVEHIVPGKKCYHEECIDKNVCNKTVCRTIFMMGDERVSRAAEINNYLQLKTRYFDKEILSFVMDSSPLEEETISNFTDRIEKTFLETLSELTNPKIIFILGVGTDGHTAGIFPMDEVSFRRVYPEDRTYVPVYDKTFTIDSRASFTPSWILNNADEVIGYVVSESKKQILEDLNKNDKKLNERPAELLKLHKRVYVYTDIDIAPEEASESE
jgi:6-phosphogluconolactonase/glucosamine-6-phosphate isomerase/deaminase